MPRANARPGGAAFPDSGAAASGGTVSAAYLRTVLDYGEAAGVSTAEQLAAAGIDGQALALPAARVPCARYLALLDWLEARTGDPHVGLHAGAQFRPRHYAEMGYVVLTTPTVREAVLQGIRYEALANDIGRTRLVESAEGGEMRWAPLHGPLSRHAHELHMATWSVFAQWLLGDSVHARLVLFPHAAPPDVREHERVFGCPVVFGADRHAMQLDAALLARPSLQADAEMQAQMTRIADAQLRQHAAADAGSDEIARMRAFVRGALAQGEPTLAAAAACLRLPVRTLQRRLQARGLSYSILVDGERHALAVQYLADPAMPLAQLAMQLGFSEQSAFTHAFKRWTQQTPTAWRQHHVLGARD
ncbi:AraC family transcriptional regulator [Cupriavidus sp. USMAA2-4]|uniref:AraC family transcriptional regulator n=1 Tax=unclassified Cupriavidus TaxID=2640874 RepID=UPI0008A6844A|nr:MULTISPECIES: AraC family transcriptional regulator [unclassified Cupriavidus]AOY92249.1 AraC family transcriptional regulator [Cupriavidus sp. USMAA2-4]AOZ01037.1 AraC family transcriptional regulator [Cupriavidus sp. USMAHM13]